MLSLDKPHHLSTGVKSLDDFLYGGIPVGAPSVIYGVPNVGKTIFCAQIAVLCNKLYDLPVLYLDTEAMWDSSTWDIWYGFFRKRLSDLPEKANINFVYKPNIFTLGEYF